MGYVKDWGNMLEGFFREMFFEAKWMFLPEEVLPVPMVTESFYDGGEKQSAFLKGNMPKKWGEEQWDENEEKQIREEMHFEELLRLGFDTEQSFDTAQSFGMTKSFYDGENFELENFWETVNDRESFTRKENSRDYVIEDSDAYEYAAEDFEKKLYGERVYTNVWEEVLTERATYDTAREKYGLDSGEELILPGSEYGGYISEREKMSLRRDKVEKILNGFKETGSGQHHDIKIEMVRNESARDEFDIDETLDMLTERLCNLMAKGADGLYL